MAKLRRTIRIVAVAVAVAAAALLAGSGGSALVPTVSPDKAALEQHADAVIAAAHARAALVAKPVDPALERPAPVASRPEPAGLVELPSPFPTTEYVLGTWGWQATAAGQRVSVYVGSTASGERQGVVVVVSTELANDERAVAAYPAPAHAGALALRAARGDVLSLEDGAGRAFAFDVATRRYTVLR